MTIRKPRKYIRNQRGATFVEYAVALAILIVVFIGVGVLLELTAIRVAKRSVEGVRFDAPCARERADDTLAAGQCY